MAGVTVLGTGIMGAGMARNLARAGLPVTVWNRSRDKAEALADVATVADSAAEAVRGADVVVTMLYDADSVASVVAETGDAFGPESVWVQQSTVGLDGERRLAGLAADLGIVYVDAPVLGTRKPAEDGQLTVLASGPESVRPVLEPVFDAIGSRTLWLGEAGLGSRLKLVVNGWVLTVLEGTATSLALARELGLDPQLFLDAVRGGALDAPYVQVKGAGMLAGEYPTSFALAGAAKDAALIEAATVEAGLDPSVVRALKAPFDRALAAGLGELDMSAVYEAHSKTEPRES